MTTSHTGTNEGVRQDYSTVNLWPASSPESTRRLAMWKAILEFFDAINDAIEAAARELF